MASTQNPRPPSIPGAPATADTGRFSTATSPSRLPLRNVWLAGAAAPIIFLITIVAASIIVGLSGVSDPNTIQRTVTQNTGWLLVGAEVLIAAFLWTRLRADGLSLPDLGWRLPPGRSLTREIAIGSGAGLTLAAAYFAALSPAMVWAQRTFGDYVPPGELISSLGASLAPFFVANVILAPLVEETLYRGYLLNRLMRRFGLGTAIAIDCTLFGLLHWSGGFWYILLTGVVAGGTLAGLFAWRRTIITSYAAHLALNTAEFCVIAWTMTQ
jgi:membrane protease YdiL (CAAX protease family)